MYIKIDPRYLPAVRFAINLTKVVTFIFIIVLSALSFLTLYNNRYSQYQSQFILGGLPKSLPDGFYKGSSPLPTGSWLGKRFDLKSKGGVNIFRSGEGTSEKIPFRMYEGDGLRDRGLRVIKIDYNIPQNPFWIRPALDEMVEVEPGKFLGKIHYRYASDSSFVLGYFWQEK